MFEQGSVDIHSSECWASLGPLSELKETDDGEGGRRTDFGQGSDKWNAIVLDSDVDLLVSRRGETWVGTGARRSVKAFEVAEVFEHIDTECIGFSVADVLER